jgi:hypothetical protein
LKLGTRNYLFGCGGRIRTFDDRINNPVPYQLGYATEENDELGTMSDERAAGNGNVHYSAFIVQRSPFILEAMKGVEPLSSGLQDRRSVYPIELHRH